MKLPEGTIFRFTNPDARGRDFTHGSWYQLCVALFKGELNSCDGCYRRINAKDSHAGTVESLPLQSIEIVGLMPKSSKGATAWDESFRFPHDMKPGTVFQFTTQPKWWSSEYDWTTRMVVMFPVVAGSGLRVRFRRMLKDYPYTSEWDPTSDEFEIVGHLTPDQLYVTDSTVGLKPEHDTATEKEIGITIPDVVDPRFTEGTVFRLTGKKPDWWHAEEDEWDKPCVVIDLEKSHNGAVPLRRLLEPGVFDSYHFFPEVDAFEIIGQLPSGKLDSIDLDDVIRLPAQQLALGTKFRFNKIPARWPAETNAKIGDIFSVIENSGFTGVGQCLATVSDPRHNGWWSARDGVLPTDDIEIVADEVVEDKTEELELKLAVGTRFSFNSFPSRWKKLGIASNSTVFEVTEPPSSNNFRGEGQAVKIVESDCDWYSHIDGVLATDDISIVVDKVELPLGTKFRFTSRPDRWVTSGSLLSLDTVFKVVEYKDFDGEGQAVQREGVKVPWCSTDGVVSTDDIEIFEDELEKLPLGIRFSFRTFPSRWINDMRDDSSTVFKVIENEGFDGEGQCITKIGGTATWYHRIDGVLSSDDIVSIEEVEDDKPVQHKTTLTWRGWEIEQSSVGWSAKNEDGTYAFGEDLNVVLDCLHSHESERLKHHQKQEVERLTMKIQELEKDNGELKGTATNWRDTAKRLEKENGQLKGSLADSMASYYAAHRTIKKLSEKKPNGVLAFVKKIW